MRWAFLFMGILLGILTLGMARFAFVELPPAVHHHANFAVFVDGQKLDLSGNRYMEDVTACAADPAGIRPQDRAHLHNNDADVVHVHHAGATWGHLLANLGMGLGDRFLILDDGRRFFEGEDGRTLKFMLNGQQVLELQNRMIRSEDRVVISVGPESADEVLQTQFVQVASNAGHFNEVSDPAGCAGAMKELTLGQRLRNAFWGA